MRTLVLRRAGALCRGGGVGWNAHRSVGLHTANDAHKHDKHERHDKHDKHGEVAWRCDEEVEEDARRLFLLSDAVSLEQQHALCEELQPRLRRKHYNGSHWDNVIVDYKETELLRWNNPACADIIQQLQATVRGYLQLDEQTVFLPPHVVDLSAQGYIQPHVDSIKFSGGFIAGLSLLSTRILRLVNVHNKKQIEVPLQPGSLYILSHKLRYEYEHGILGPQDMPTHADPVQCERRISLMLRDAHPDDAQMYKPTHGSSPHQ